MNIELTQEQAEAFGRGESITLTPKPKQWEPRGEFYALHHSLPTSTVEAAAKATTNIRTHNRLLAYVDEFGGDWEADWENRSQEKCCVNYSYSVNDRVWEWNNNYSVCTSGTVYMSRDCAKDLVAKLNSGEVVL
jgi:hypothetical protein